MLSLVDLKYKLELKLITKLLKVKSPPRIEILRFWQDYWIHIINKCFNELNIRYYDKNITPKKLYIQLRKQFKNKLVIPFADFVVCNVCTLNCKDCTGWIPYIKNKKIYKKEELINNFEQLFKFVDYIHFLSPLGGEPFMHPDLDVILDYLIKKADEGKIGFIRLVTNGTIFPKECILEKFKHPKLSISISNYEGVLNESQEQNKAKLINYIKENNIKYYMTQGFMWTDLGSPKFHSVSKVELQNTFDTCFIKNCASFIDGKLYRCGRVFVLDKNGIEKVQENECIDFYKIRNKKELKKAIYKFYSISYLNACQYCNTPKERKQVQPAIQTERVEENIIEK